ncbi:MAG: UbiA family prenyltransferase [Candidatus Omnitrophica bacterium]|nr:UbiA family prenyltransferase [Candidatus Omnitrophota bacterium]
MNRVRDNLLARANNIIERLESPQIPYGYVLFTFFFAVTLRNFLETYIDGEIASADLPADLIHYYLSYTCLAMALTVLFHFATKVPVARISRVILPSFLILILPPVTWMLVPAWRNFSIGYMFPDTHQDLPLRFLTFFGPVTNSGVMPGMRVEIALAVGASFLYFLAKGRNLWQGLWFSFLTYTVIFIYCALPFAYVTSMHALGLGDEITLPAMTNSLLFLILFLGFWQFYLYNKTYFTEIFKDIRPLRLLHFEFMFFLGVVLSQATHPYPLPPDSSGFFHGIFLTAATGFAWLFAVTTNNIVDYDIDAISNPRRPTVTGVIPARDYKYFPWLFFALAVIYSGAVNLISLFLILVFMGNYFLYSTPPLRLKRLTFFSKLLISLNSLVLVLLGQLFHSGNFALPLGVIFFFLVCVTATLNFIDIKDYEGDKKAGIRTLPVVLGLETSKKMIGVFFVISYITAGLVFSNSLPLLIMAGGAGVAQFFLLNRKPYREDHVLLVHLLSLAVLIFLLR